MSSHGARVTSNSTSYAVEFSAWFPLSPVSVFTTIYEFLDPAISRFVHSLTCGYVDSARSSYAMYTIPCKFYNGKESVTDQESDVKMFHQMRRLNDLG